MIRIKRRNTGWLVALGLVIAFALFAGVASPAVQLVLLGIFAVSMVASMVELGSERQSLMDTIRKAPLRNRTSPQAKEAVERARTRGGFVDDDLMVMDIGVIASQNGYDGMAMRRTRSASKDDDGLRPFVTINVAPNQAHRNSVIRFEVYNQSGEQEYVHEMRTYLREGEMNIMADHHLPLAGNPDIGGYGDWDVRVYVDGNLAALHDFTMSPSINDRTRRLTRDYDDDYDNVRFEIVDEAPPPSLESLIRDEVPQRQEPRRQSPRQTTRRRR